MAFSGLRARMGAGTSMMNDLTIIQTTQVNHSEITQTVLSQKNLNEVVKVSAVRLSSGQCKILGNFKDHDSACFEN